jgi:hypothetical protein
MPPSWPKSKPRKESATLLASPWDYFSVLKVEAVCSSETSLNVYRIARRHSRDDGIIRPHMVACTIATSTNIGETGFKVGKSPETR